jgi:2-polyprenyl-3-methyl-5-hydroxy-6-metoxy-1,4-benzoquinol methylase
MTTQNHALEPDHSSAPQGILVCPVTGSPLTVDGYSYVSGQGQSYPFEDGVLQAFVPGDENGQTTQTVQDFYSETPFPNYNDFDSFESFSESAKSGVFAKLLADQIPTGSYVLEVGCGTGQLSNYLAGTAVARVYGVDMTMASLRLGARFAQENAIEGVTFCQSNLFRPCIKQESMDVIICNGVLHHTADPEGGFRQVVNLLRPGGHVLVGLYNRIGRLPTDAMRRGRVLFGDAALFFDRHLHKDLAADKRRAWIMDQYQHPHESKHGFSEVLQWFERAGVTFVSSIPKINGQFSANEDLFRPQNPGSASDRLIVELEMLAAGGAEGGLFIMAGRKN